ncbi:PrsW family intramembrane metalloprotease [Candidatus Gracilibacteria bacterium]|nr:PrsW family intramembrane metalloprotease [Candidatus Gracilibacteria bacterium]
MTFTNLQIGTILISFLTAVILAILWQKKDQQKDKNEKNQEHFVVLMSVFFWSAFLAFALKLGLDFLKNINFERINSTFFQWFSIGMEEIVKISALIIGLEIAGKRFNEISDGIIYGVFAILGFLFFENIFYMLAYWDFAKGVWDFAGFAGQRSIFSFSIHLSTIFFSFFYATAYLKTTKQDISRPAPRQLIKQIKLLGKSKNGELRFGVGLWRFLISPITLLANIFTKFHPRLGVAIYGSLFFTIAIHILLNELLGFGGVYAFVGLVFSCFAGWMIFRRFDKMDI